jgi:hypothetical protein
MYEVTIVASDGTSYKVRLDQLPCAGDRYVIQTGGKQIAFTVKQVTLTFGGMMQPYTLQSVEVGV